VQLSIDSSGELLHRRGYRASATKAPLRETLAAGILLLLGWRGELPLADPMCGSGSFPLEAALLASGRESVDIGLMQVNWRYHKKCLTSPQLALNPYHNLRVAAEILLGCFRSREDWWEAVGCYHAPNNPERAARYQERVPPGRGAANLEQ